MSTTEKVKPWSIQTERLVSEVFNLLGLSVYSDEDRCIHSDDFLQWCRKCQGLKRKEFQSGMDKVKAGELPHPSYTAFIILCTGHGNGGSRRQSPPSSCKKSNVTDSDRAAGLRELQKMRALFWRDSVGV